ncbi:MAG: OsmC family protein [Gemmatimonas sp.]
MDRPEQPAAPQEHVPAPPPEAPTVAPTAASPARAHIIDANTLNDTVEINLLSGYAQQVDWGVVHAPAIIIDEPAPLGANSGPSPTRVLAAALASCLGASLLFCLNKSRITVKGLRTTASVALKRNEQGRLRVGSIDVKLAPEIPADQHARIGNCVRVFEDYCVVTASVRPTVEVNVTVEPVIPVE